MLIKTRTIFKPPAFKDEEQTRIAGLQHIMSWALLAALALTASVSALFGNPQTAKALAAGMLGPLVSLWLIHRGRLHTASLTSILTILGVLNYILYITDGLHDTAVLAYPAVIVIAGLLLDRPRFIACVALLILSLLVIIHGEMRGWIVNPLSRHTSSADFIYVVVIMGMTAIATRLLANNITRSIARLRTSQRALAKSNRELKHVNDKLTREITKYKRAEQARQHLLEQVQKQSQQLREIMATVPEGILLLDNDGRVIQANPPAEAYLQVLANAQVGDTLTYLGDDYIADWFSCSPKHQPHQHNLSLSTNDPMHDYRHEVQVRGGPNSIVPRTFEVVARSMRGKLPAPNYVMILREVTSQREAQAHIQQQDRLAALGQLAAGIAHDFNNILAVITLYTQLTARAAGITTRDRERLTTVYQQVNHAKDLIQQILDFSRSAVLERRPLDLLPFLKEQVKLLERMLPANILLELHYATDDDYIINADPTRIQQALMNLVVNARDAMPEGGELHIKLECLHLDGDAPTILRTPDIDKWICITIADTGCGIPPDILPHIFDPFFTTKAPGQGTGLGLSQVWGIINQHEGHIDVTSDTGGTALRLYLPAVTPPKHRAPNQVSQDLAYGNGQKILLVEDNSTARKALVESLEALNYQAIEAKNGHEALIIYASQPDIALVISDMVMPTMSGKALFHILQQRTPTVKVILLTGHPLEKELEDLTQQGLSGWLLKPVDLGQLAVAVATVLEA